MGKKIIIVEDNPGIVEVMKIILSSQNYEVYVATDGLQLFNILPKFEPDIILLDLKLPGMSGQEIIKLLKKDNNYKATPIIVISASQHLKKDVIQAGASSFIAKPFDVDVLLETVNRQIGANRSNP